MLNTIFRLLLTFNATSLLLIVFFVQKGCTLAVFFPDCRIFAGIPNMVSYFLYFLVPVILTGLSIWMSASLGSDSFGKGETVSIEYANNSFLPSYLGYFFVALSIGDLETLCFVYIVLFIFTYSSQALYFNPLFLLFGYTFYNVTTRSQVVVFLISREKFKRPTDVTIDKVFRINNYTFLQRG